MRIVTIELLSEQLRDHVALAASGERVLVTDGGEIVAELKPHRGVNVPVGTHPAVRRGVEEGQITPPARRRTGVPPRVMPMLTLERLLEELAEDREDR